MNILLLCVWVADYGRGALDTMQLRGCVRRSRDWQATVVKPLRAIRRACRDQPLGVPDFLLQTFRPLVQETELDAEHVEQLVLADAVKNLPVENGYADEQSHHAQQTLLNYLEVADVRRDTDLDECLRIICAAAFPGADLALLD